MLSCLLIKAQDEFGLRGSQDPCLEFSFWGVPTRLSTSSDTWPPWHILMTSRKGSPLSWIYGHHPRLTTTKTTVWLLSPQRMKNSEGDLPSPSRYKKYRHRNFKQINQKVVICFARGASSRSLQAVTFLWWFVTPTTQNWAQLHRYRAQSSTRLSTLRTPAASLGSPGPPSLQSAGYQFRGPHECS